MVTFQWKIVIVFEREDQFLQDNISRLIKVLSNIKIFNKFLHSDRLLVRFFLSFLHDNLHVQNLSLKAVLHDCYSFLMTVSFSCFILIL